MNPTDRFTCEEVLRRLEEYIDRELTAREMQLVREHLEICAACADAHAFEAASLETLRGKLRRLDVPADLLERVSLTLAAARAAE